MIFCDSTSTLDRFNSSLFVLSTSHCAGGLPLAVMITSDEQEETIQQDLEMVKQVLPAETFYGVGVKRGPAIIVNAINLCECFPLKSIGVCFLHHWLALS